MTTALDLFCGAASGWALGLHRAGVRTVAACEIDDWRRAVFARRFPEARTYADVRDLDAARLVADLGYLPDWIVGSPPCQDASCANAGGRGIDGDRTGLFFEAIRLVGECRPRWVCLENVGALRTRGADRVLAALEAFGYACWPLVVGAVHAGAPHRRQRVWIVAADAAQGGRGPGRARRLAGGATGSDQQAFPQSADPDADGRRQPELAQRDGRPFAGEDGAFGDDALGFHADAADADSGELWQQPGRCGGAHWPGAAQPELDAGDADSAGLALGEGERGDAWAQLPPALRAVAAGSGWNGGADGLARGLRMADGLPAGLARRCIAAYGDAVVPALTEAIARAVLAADGLTGGAR